MVVGSVVAEMGDQLAEAQVQDIEDAEVESRRKMS